MTFIRRNYPRIPLQASFVTLRIKDKIIEDAQCINISMGGMCLACTKNIQDKIGSVELVFESPEELIEFKGEFMVRWMKKNHENEKMKYFGIQFTYYDVENLSRLARIIVEQMKTAECEVVM